MASTNSQSSWIVQVNNVALGIDICWWQGPGTRVYQETNGIPGLQAHASSGCEADLEVLVAFVARGGQCSI